MIGPWMQDSGTGEYRKQTEFGSTVLRAYAWRSITEPGRFEWCVWDHSGNEQADDGMADSMDEAKKLADAALEAT